ncbi:MAG TPA: EAL domain-containing protein, partial [Ilumatobacteraceae bacterium]
MAVDLDDFYAVNEELGLDGGDQALAIVASRLEACVREKGDRDLVQGAPAATGAVTRHGGDTFLAMFDVVDDAVVAGRLAQRAADAIAAPLQIGDAAISLTASIGTALSDSTCSAEQLLLASETALRKARATGRGQQTLLSMEQRHEIDRTNAMTRELRDGLVANEFVLVYQPKISLETDRVIGVEALIRWQHPARGFVAPIEFMAAAESSGMIVDIGAWVFQQACRQASAWRNAFPKCSLTVAVNVSARQFRAGLVDTMRAALQDAHLDPSAICVEMTETTVMDDIERTVDILAELKDMGLSVSIDDFGTGYSSLEYLHRMPLDEVKIDRSFISGLGVNREQSAIVASVISLAQAMNHDVVAEGVETFDQLERLRTLGCDLAQGYFLAKPMSSSGIDAILVADAAGERFSFAGSSDDTGSLVMPGNVLIVDDAADIRELARMSLTASGFSVEEAGSGAAALALARRLHPDCVLLDVSMPDMTGIDVCSALRADPATAACTIVMLTVRAEAADKAEAFLVGADDYIVKPFSPRDLVSRVRSAMKRRRDNVNSIGRQLDPGLYDLLQSRRDESQDAGLLARSQELSTRQ